MQTITTTVQGQIASLLRDMAQDARAISTQTDMLRNELHNPSHIGADQCAASVAHVAGTLAPSMQTRCDELIGVLHTMPTMRDAYWRANMLHVAAGDIEAACDVLAIVVRSEKRPGHLPNDYIEFCQEGLSAKVDAFMREHAATRKAIATGAKVESEVQQ
ncbi:hypothetical protein EIP75_16115 [Aquabacterium soli]|uniref:Uncharacterized protein n=1 Tax=Aquabacterium soli TaxID=2493092 RepID=A0A3R8TRJ7_9BURK|nr:hypothetical protein [Aquabacterium soli]RRS03216.1 hypothetical protein EIP75_16115 [Aquabacterium soli]